MMLKRIFVALLFAVLLSAGWRLVNPGGGLLAWLQPRSAPAPRSIEFDNGSARDERAASAPALVAVPPSRAQGRMRKCRKGESVIYTDAPCPPGSREHTVSGGTVTVVDGPKPPTGEALGARQPNVRDLLGPDRGQSLADKQMERAMSR